MKSPRKVRIPTGPPDPEAILKILKTSNSHLPTQNMRETKVADQWSDYRDAVIILNEESLPLIITCGGVIYYGFISIELRDYKADSRDALHTPIVPFSVDTVPLNPTPSDLIPTSSHSTPEDIECRNVCSRFFRVSSANQKSNTVLVE